MPLVDFPCPCDRGRMFSSCCGPCLEGHAQPRSAPDLMRSRYSAFALGRADYLLSSRHSRTRPEALELEGDDTVWEGLEILSCTKGEQGDASGEVRFRARYRQGSAEGLMVERSRFLFEEGRWYYLDAAPVPGDSASRNGPCPCGSGRKTKRCCGKVRH